MPHVVLEEVVPDLLSPDLPPRENGQRTVALNLKQAVDLAQPVRAKERAKGSSREISVMVRIGINGRRDGDRGDNAPAWRQEARKATDERDRVRKVLDRFQRDDRIELLTGAEMHRVPDDVLHVWAGVSESGVRDRGIGDVNADAFHCPMGIGEEGRAVTRAACDIEESSRLDEA